MRLQNPISALTPTVDAGVLHVLARAETDFTATQVQSLLPEAHSESGVRKALRRLVSQGLVHTRTTGNTHAYALNRDHLLAGPVVAMAQAKHTLLERIRQEIDAWDFIPLDARVFGSAARNEMRTDSDIDLFIVVPDGTDQDGAEEAISALAQKVTAWTGNDTRPLVYGEQETGGKNLLQTISKESLRLNPSNRWLEHRLTMAEAA